jgi:large subunit ribosomal protein L1
MLSKMKTKTKKAEKEVKGKYNIEEAVKLAKQGSSTKFDGTIEVHINLSLENKKQDQTVRYTTTLPNGTGKTKKVAVFASKKVPNADMELTEADIERLEKSLLRPKVDFDVLVAEPRFMSKLAKAARVLGPAGAMPNPKNGTVAEDVEKAVEQIKKGKVEIRTEPNGKTIHTIMGKVSFEESALVENFKEIISSLRQNKPAKANPDWLKTCFISSTMGKSIEVDLTTL